MTARVVSWSERLELTVETPGGETVTLDVPSLLHDAGLLSKITRAEGPVPLRVNHVTGKYVGVHIRLLSSGYSALSGRSLVASSSAREVAYGRALGRKRRLQEEERRPHPPTPPRQQEATYVPTSPAYEPTSTTAQEGDDDECEFVKERTREERDEEGRANAISLEEE